MDKIILVEMVLDAIQKPLGILMVIIVTTYLAYVDSKDSVALVDSLAYVDYKDNVALAENLACVDCKDSVVLAENLAYVD